MWELLLYMASVGVAAGGFLKGGEFAMFAYVIAICCSLYNVAQAIAEKKP